MTLVIKAHNKYGIQIYTNKKVLRENVEILIKSKLKKNPFQTKFTYHISDFDA